LAAGGRPASTAGDILCPDADAARFLPEIPQETPGCASGRTDPQDDPTSRVSNAPTRSKVTQCGKFSRWREARIDWHAFCLSNP
jgi:hypothetical protein